MTIAERRRKVRILYRTGKFSQKTLADFFGVSARTIRDDLKNRPLIGRNRGNDGPKISPEATARIIELLRVEIARGRSIDELSLRAGLSQRSVWRLLNDSPRRMTFDVADDIVTRVWSPLRWISDEALSDWYLSGRGWWEAAA